MPFYLRIIIGVLFLTLIYSRNSISADDGSARIIRLVLLIFSRPASDLMKDEEFY